MRSFSCLPLYIFFAILRTKKQGGGGVLYISSVILRTSPHKTNRGAHEHDTAAHGQVLMEVVVEEIASATINRKVRARGSGAPSPLPTVHRVSMIMTYQASGWLADALGCGFSGASRR